jgi:hypothetical protein
MIEEFEALIKRHSENLMRDCTTLADYTVAEVALLEKDDKSFAALTKLIEQNALAIGRIADVIKRLKGDKGDKSDPAAEALAAARRALEQA